MTPAQVHRQVQQLVAVLQSANRDAARHDDEEARHRVAWLIDLGVELVEQLAEAIDVMAPQAPQAAEPRA